MEYRLTSEKSVKEVARDLGIQHHHLDHWRAQYRKRGELTFPGNGKENLSSREAENRRIKKELQDTQIECNILKNLGCLYEKTVYSYLFIWKHTKLFSVMKMCQVLKVFRSGYYHWLGNPISPRRIKDLEWKQKITDIYQKSRQRYGSPRIYQQLLREGYAVGKKRVEHLMS